MKNVGKVQKSTKQSIPINKQVNQNDKSSTLDFFKEEINRINKIKDSSDHSKVATSTSMCAKPGIDFDKGKLKDLSNKEIFNADQMRKSFTKFDPKLEKKIQLNELINSKDVQSTKKFTEKVESKKSVGFSKTPFKPTKFKEGHVKSRQIDFAPNKDLIPELGNKDFDQDYMKNAQSKSKNHQSKTDNIEKYERMLNEDKSNEIHPHGQIIASDQPIRNKPNNDNHESKYKEQNKNDNLLSDDEDYGKFDFIEDIIEKTPLKSETNTDNANETKYNTNKNHKNVSSENKYNNSRKCYDDNQKGNSEDKLAKIIEKSSKTNNCENKLIQSDFNIDKSCQTKVAEVKNAETNTILTYSDEISNNKSNDLEEYKCTNQKEEKDNYQLEIKEEFEIKNDATSIEYEHISIEAYKYIKFNLDFLSEQHH